MLATIKSRSFCLLACCLKNVKISIYKTIILPVVLHGRNEVTGGWRKLHNEELHNLYSSPSIIRMIKSRSMRWTRHVVQVG
jgi:hypothetical protein